MASGLRQYSQEDAGTSHLQLAGAVHPDLVVPVAALACLLKGREIEVGQPDLDARQRSADVTGNAVAVQ